MTAERIRRFTVYLVSVLFPRAPMRGMSEREVAVRLRPSGCGVMALPGDSQPRSEERWR